MTARVRATLIAAAAAAVVTAAGVLALDAVLARALGPDAGRGGAADAFAAAMRILDRATGMTWPKKEQLATALIVAGAALWWWWRRGGHALLLLGLTHAVSRTFGGELKPLLGRLRPTEALARGHLDDSFGWSGGIAFPSGHVAHYAAIAFAVAYAVPRARVPAFALLAFVVVARVGTNAHFLSDAAASITIAALACAGWATALARLERSGSSRRRPAAGATT